jgi:hypothetical protein
MEGAWNKKKNEPTENQPLFLCPSDKVIGKLLSTRLKKQR